MTHTIPILRWSGDKKRGTYQEWSEALEVEDYEVCAGHHRPIVDGVCPDCAYEQREGTEYLGEMYRLYGTTDFSQDVERAIIQPTGYVRPTWAELMAEAKHGRELACRVLHT